MKCELDITVKTNEDNSLDIMFDGDLRCTVAQKCRILASIAQDLFLEPEDLTIVIAMMRSGLTDSHITGDALRITFGKPGGI